MGAIPECFRGADSVVRSNHPHVSFAASGPRADFVTSDHALESSFGEQSPLARVYESGGSVLLIGVGHDSNSSLHLAEFRASFASKQIVRHGAPISRDGATYWTEFSDIDSCSDDFPQIGQAYENASNQVVRGKVGYAVSVLFPQCELVDFAVGWIEANRD